MSINDLWLISACKEEGINLYTGGAFCKQNVAETTAIWFIIGNNLGILLNKCYCSVRFPRGVVVGSGDRYKSHFSLCIALYGADDTLLGTQVLDHLKLTADAISVEAQWRFMEFSLLHATVDDRCSSRCRRCCMITLHRTHH